MLFITTALSIGSTEALLRVSGHQPWKVFAGEHPARRAREPFTFANDALRGWKNKAGRFLIPAYSDGAADIRMTILQGGTRATGLAANSHPLTIMLVGGSFTEGRGVSDEETFAWKLQARLSSVTISNYGTAGYGTCQSFLTLTNVLERPPSPAFVVYGFNDHHEKRNVATSDWIETVLEHSRSGRAYIPYCTLGPDGDLVLHRPEAFSIWPLGDHLALVAFLQKRYLERTTRWRAREARAVTERLLVEMKNASSAHGAGFLVVLLKASEEAKAHYIGFLQQHNIPYVDCAFPLTDDLRVPGDGHPNGLMHTRYADCIAETLFPLIGHDALN
jgi:hypothetical protein